MKNAEKTPFHRQNGRNDIQRSPIPPHYRSNDNTPLRSSLGPAIVSGISRFTSSEDERAALDICHDTYTSLPSRRRAARERHSHERTASRAIPDSSSFHGMNDKHSHSGLNDFEEPPPSFQLEGLLANDPNVVVLGLNELQDRLRESLGDLEKGPPMSGPEWTWEAQSHVFSVIRRPRRVMRRYARLCIVKHRVDLIQRIEFVLKAAEGFIAFGAPAHRYEALALAASGILGLQASFVVLPGCLIASFADPTSPSGSRSRNITAADGFHLGKLQAIQNVFYDVCHDKISAIEGTRAMQGVLRTDSAGSPWGHRFLMFLVAALIAPLGFGGSFADALIAGLFSFGIAIAREKVHAEEWLTAFKVLAIITASSVARWFSAIPDSHICYNAVVSASIISLLPGLLVMTASLEVASKAMISGATKLAWALMYSMLIGFALSAGSAAYLVIDPEHGVLLDSLAAELSPAAEMLGEYEVEDGNWNVPLVGVLTYTPRRTLLADLDWIDGCPRPDDSPWYAQHTGPAHLWWLVPAFALANTLANGQPLWRRDTLAMVVVACVSFAVNRYTASIIFQRGHVVSFVGATVCGLLGRTYSRFVRGRHVAPFAIMAPGILFLLPSGLALAGGVSAEASVQTLDMGVVLVSLGISAGILFSQAIVYTISGSSGRAELLTLSF